MERVLKNYNYNNIFNKNFVFKTQFVLCYIKWTHQIMRVQRTPKWFKRVSGLF